MKTRLAVLLLAGLFCVSAAHAQDKKAAEKAAPAAAEKKLLPQQKKMAKCNKDAKEKNISGPDRKKFMSTCLKG